MTKAKIQKEARIDNLKIEAWSGLQLWFWKLVHLTGFQSSFLLFEKTDMISFLWWCNERSHAIKPFSYHFMGKKILLEWVQNIPLRWLNTVLTVCEHMSFAKSWQEKGCSSQAETWQVKNILMKDFDWQVKCDVFVVSMATWTIEYNLKILLLLCLHKIRSLDFPINFNTAYYNSSLPCKTYLTKFLQTGF